MACDDYEDEPFPIPMRQNPFLKATRYLSLLIASRFARRCAAFLPRDMRMALAMVFTAVARTLGA